MEGDTQREDLELAIAPMVPIHRALDAVKVPTGVTRNNGLAPSLCKVTPTAPSWAQDCPRSHTLEPLIDPGPPKSADAGTGVFQNHGHAP